MRATITDLENKTFANWLLAVSEGLAKENRQRPYTLLINRYQNLDGLINSIYNGISDTEMSLRLYCS